MEEGQPHHGSHRGVAGFRLYRPDTFEFEWIGGNTSAATSLGFGASELSRFRGGKVIGSSDKVHVVDALAITGEEGRGSLRKASGSWQTSFDPRISEWGNPARKGQPELNT